MLSRYAFTDSNGYRVGPVVEARDPAEARAAVVGRTGHAGRLNCTHLSDVDPGWWKGTDPIFFLGPDGIE